MMNILLINTFDIRGGAARAAYRLLNALNHNGDEAIMLVKKKESENNKVLQISPPIGQREINQLTTIKTIYQSYINGNRTPLSDTLYSLGYPGYDLSTSKTIEQADIINLHWIADFQSVESVTALLKTGKPVVWTFHDENPYTGGCHYTAGCTLYKNDCKPCPQLSEDPYQLAFCNLENKLNSFKNKNLTIVSPSRWLADKAKQSSLFRDANVVTIPNSIEQDLFIPKDKNKMKTKLGLTEGGVTILTGISNWRPRRKGFAEFLSAIGKCLNNERFKQLLANKKLHLISFGPFTKDLEGLDIPIKAIGRIDSDMELSDVYGAADIFVLPSLEDNLPNTVLEAMSCSVPVISFNTGGVPDLIQDGINGRLVPSGNTQALADTMVELIFNPQIRTRLGEQARKLVEQNYSLENQARNYSELFHSLLPAGVSSSKFFEPHQVSSESLGFTFNKKLLPLFERHAIKQ